MRRLAGSSLKARLQLVKISWYCTRLANCRAIRSSESGRSSEKYVTDGETTTRSVYYSSISAPKLLARWRFTSKPCHSTLLTDAEHSLKKITEEKPFNKTDISQR